MERATFSDFSCSIAQTLEVVGEWWTLLIVRDLFVGMKRFDELQADLGIASNTLTLRLKRLVDKGVVKKAVTPEDARSFQYTLTAKGKDLYPVLLAMLSWGDKWGGLEQGKPLVLIHQTCGKATKHVPACAECGKTLKLEELIFSAGPGGRNSPGTERIGRYLTVHQNIPE